MDGDVFDTDLFIDEVEKRPAIWDMASTEYSNKVSKRRAWEEIVLIFSDSGDGDDNKKILGTYTSTYLLLIISNKNTTFNTCISIDVQPTSHSIGNGPPSVKAAMCTQWALSQRALNACSTLLIFSLNVLRCVRWHLSCSCCIPRAVQIKSSQPTIKTDIMAT
jgi:hypothetical protein